MKNRKKKHIHIQINFINLIFILIINFTFSQTVALDNNFGNMGKVEVNLGNTFILKDTKISSENNIYVLGQITENNITKTIILKYTSAGNLDSNFGVNGILKTNFSLLNDFIPSVLEIVNNKIIIAGTYLHTPNTFFPRELILIKINEIGIIDNAFGNNGFVMLNLNAYPTSYRYHYGTHVSLLKKFTNNDLLLMFPVSAIIIGISSVQKYIFVKINSNGNVIQSFGANGVKEISAKNSLDIRDTKILLNDNYLISGTNGDNGLLYLFNNTGNFLNSHNLQIQGLHSFLNSDSNFSDVYSTGSNFSNGVLSFYIVKFNFNLNHVLNFGNNGILNIPALGKIKVSNNRIFNVVSSLYGSNNQVFKVYDYALNVILNTGFGNNGFFDINFGNNSHNLNSLYNIDNNKLLIIGTHGENLVMAGIIFEPQNLQTTNNSLDLTKIYPNPTQDILNINSITLIKSVSIYSIFGHLLKEHNNFENKDVQLNLKHLLSGIYFVKVNDENQVQTIKIIKN